MSKPTIAFVAVTYQHGGTEQILMAQARHLVERGHPVVAMIPGDSRLDQMAHELERSGVHTPRVARLFDPNRNIAASFAGLCSIFRETSPALVHFHVPWAPAGGEAVLAAFAARVPRRIRTEQNPVMTPLSWRQRLKMQVLDRTVDKIVFVSDGNRRRHIENGRPIADKALVIPNGVDMSAIEPIEPARKPELRRKLNLPDDVLLAVTTSSLEIRKGTLEFIRAAAIAAQDCPDLHFALIGDGPIRTEATALAADLGLGERVHFLGFRNDIKQILGAFDIYVQPSHYEGLALSMLEALAAGLPMVTTKVDGVADVVPPNGALLVDIHDVPGLGAAMRRLAQDGELRRELVSRTQPHVRGNFTTAAMLAAYVALYEELGALSEVA